MTRTHGRCRKGERLRAKVPHVYRKTLTFLAALRHDRISARCVFDGPINGRSFQAYVEQFLVPTLKAGDIVMLDNLGSHKGDAARRAIRAVSARMIFLPPYSPDLNPIEQVFAKLERLQSNPSRQHGNASPHSSNAFPHRNAPITSRTQDMRQPNHRIL
ncbi:transposase [Komagataeibacter pomaceti]|nr:transposase [Novacetimonas pomaceti]